MVLFTNNKKIGGFYNPRLFGTELRMTDQVKYLRVILDKKLDWKAHLENKMRSAKLALHIGSVVVLWERLRGYHRGWWPGYGEGFRGDAHSFLCFAGMVEESEAEKFSKKVLSLAADDVFGNTGGMRSTLTSA
jgi:translation initiation factor IF-1